jgi:hypothetical protein
MRNPDTVMCELGQLYDFNKEIARFRIRKTAKPGSDKKDKISCSCQNSLLQKQEVE